MPPIIDCVSIIESLQHHEKHTGELLAKHLQGQGRCAVYTNAETETQFLSAIQDADRRTRSLGERLALHFEVHGDEHGFHLADGTLVPWHRVKQDIQNLNFTQKNHLLVSMAVCQGLWLLAIVSATDKSPFHSLVASQEIIPVVGIERGFPVFFDSLFAGVSIEEAVHQLNLAQNGEHPNYRWVTSECMFHDAYQKYLVEKSSPKAIEARGNWLVNQLILLGRAQESQREFVMSIYRESIKESELPYFEQYRAKFFMHDAYRENMAEFCPSYEAMVAKRR